MNMIHKLIQSIFDLLFGDFNGIQVLIYPMTLFWWIDSDSFLLAITSLLTNQRQLFPVGIFFLLLLFLLFLIIKNSSSIFSNNKTTLSAEKRSFGLMVIEVHKLLLIMVIAAVLLFVLASFLRYYYGISVSLKTIYPVMFRLFGIVFILFYSLKNCWTQSYREQGKSMERSALLVLRDFSRQQQEYLAHALALVVLTLVGSFIYNLIILNLLLPLFVEDGRGLQLMLLPPTGIWSLLYDVGVFGIAFLLSNLLFSPLVRVIVHITNRLSPQQPKPGGSDA
ncbi:MAG TPA: hypothetical protein PKH19_05520 [Candidatus Syntrophosphaera sp.]|nr:hypothetical protein [Candidatus Syntrophosphaera sp.]